jgi:hypothetical protein
VSDIPQWMLVEFMPGNWAADNPPEIVKNWARFRFRGGSSTSCYSLEGRYRSPQHWHPTQTIVPIDLKLAVVTEESWRGIPSHKHKFVLCWHWVYAWSRGHICKHLRQHGLPIELSEYDEVLTAAMASFCMELQKVQHQMINAWTHSNDNLASLHGKLIDTLPRIAEATRSHGKLLVTPIGNTCVSITQFTGTANAAVIDEPEAEVIRGDPEMEVDSMREFQCRQITEVNIRTGHCIVEVEGFDGQLPGKISDPALEQPNNVYTRALNGKTPFVITAKPVKREGVLHKLYISDARA